MTRTIRIGQYEIQLLARDQYNDYSVRYDYAVRVLHLPTQKARRWDVGSAGPESIYIEVATRTEGSLLSIVKPIQTNLSATSTGSTNGIGLPSPEFARTWAMTVPAAPFTRIFTST